MVVYTVLVVRAAVPPVVVGLAGRAVSATGQTVVYRGIVSVTTRPLAQSVTLGAQDVIVYVLVV